MSNPLVPNYKKDVGRLVTDRYDFEDHIQGNNFRHKAEQIDLFPTLVIGSQTVETVQEALNELSTIISAPAVPDASTSTKGIVQLAGDLTGTATNVLVKGLQGYPITTLVPSANQVLTWTGAAWSPANPSNIFTPGGDLSGSNVSQQVERISGLSNKVDILPSLLLFDEATSNPTVTQADATSGDGNSLYIQAQTSLAASTNGGEVGISGGASGSGGKSGGVILGLNKLNSALIDIREVDVNRKVLALLTNSALTTTEMPSNTGDMVIYIADAATAPTTGNPLNGTILYSVGGRLRTKYSDGNDFEIGSIPNPSVWGSTGEQTYTNKSVFTTSGAVVQDAFTYSIPNNYSIKIDVSIVGKEISSTTNESYQVNMAMGYTTSNSGSLIPVGSLVSYDIRNTAGASSWTVPTITTSSGNIIVKTGAAGAGVQVKWFTVVQLTIIKGL